MLAPSTGEQRRAARTAGRFSAGSRISRPASCVRVQIAQQAAQHDLALVFIAMHTRAQQHRGPGRAAQHGDRHRDHAVGMRIVRERHAQMPDMPTRRVKRNGAADPGHARRQRRSSVPNSTDSEKQTQK